MKINISNFTKCHFSSIKQFAIILVLFSFFGKGFELYGQYGEEFEYSISWQVAEAENANSLDVQFFIDFTLLGGGYGEHNLIFYIRDLGGNEWKQYNIKKVGTFRYKVNQQIHYILKNKSYELAVCSTLPMDDYKGTELFYYTDINYSYNYGTHFFEANNKESSSLYWDVEFFYYNSIGDIKSCFKKSSKYDTYSITDSEIESKSCAYPVEVILATLTDGSSTYTKEIILNKTPIRYSCPEYQKHRFTAINPDNKSTDWEIQFYDALGEPCGNLISGTDDYIDATKPEDCSSIGRIKATLKFGDEEYEMVKEFDAEELRLSGSYNNGKLTLFVENYLDINKVEWNIEINASDYCGGPLYYKNSLRTEENKHKLVIDIENIVEENDCEIYEIKAIAHEDLRESNKIPIPIIENAFDVRFEDPYNISSGDINEGEVTVLYGQSIFITIGGIDESELSDGLPLYSYIVTHNPDDNNPYPFTTDITQLKFEISPLSLVKDDNLLTIDIYKKGNSIPIATLNTNVKVDPSANDIDFSINIQHIANGTKVTPSASMPIDPAKIYDVYYRLIYTSSTGEIILSRSFRKEDFIPDTIASTIIYEYSRVFVTLKVDNYPAENESIYGNIETFPLLIYENLGCCSRQDYSYDSYYMIGDESGDPDEPLVVGRPIDFMFNSTFMVNKCSTDLGYYIYIPDFQEPNQTITHYDTWIYEKISGDLLNVPEKKTGYGANDRYSYTFDKGGDYYIQYNYYIFNNGNYNNLYCFNEAFHVLDKFDIEMSLINGDKYDLDENEIIVDYDQLGYSTDIQSNASNTSSIVKFIKGKREDFDILITTDYDKGLCEGFKVQSTASWLAIDEFVESGFHVHTTNNTLRSRQAELIFSHPDFESYSVTIIQGIEETPGLATNYSIGENNSFGNYNTGELQIINPTDESPFSEAPTNTMIIGPGDQLSFHAMRLPDINSDFVTKWTISLYSVEDQYEYLSNEFNANDDITGDMSWPQNDQYHYALWQPIAPELNDNYQWYYTSDGRIMGAITLSVSYEDGNGEIKTYTAKRSIEFIQPGSTPNPFCENELEFFHTLHCTYYNNTTAYEWVAEYKGVEVGRAKSTENRIVLREINGITFDGMYYIKFRPLFTNGYYGNYEYLPCKVKTPAFPEIHITCNDCGDGECNFNIQELMANSATRLSCTAVPEATRYQWKFTDKTTNTSTYAYTDNWYLQLETVKSIHPGSEYDIAVNAYARGVWSQNYDNVCSLTLPELKIQPCLSAEESAENPAKFNTIISLNNFLYNREYLFTFYNGDEIIEFQTDRQFFPYTDVADKNTGKGLYAGHTYEVYVQTIYDGVKGPLSEPCNVTMMSLQNKPEIFANSCSYSQCACDLKVGYYSVLRCTQASAHPNSGGRISYLWTFTDKSGQIAPIEHSTTEPRTTLDEAGIESVGSNQIFEATVQFLYNNMMGPVSDPVSLCTGLPEIQYLDACGQTIGYISNFGIQQLVDFDGNAATEYEFWFIGEKEEFYINTSSSRFNMLYYPQLQPGQSYKMRVKAEFTDGQGGTIWSEYDMFNSCSFTIDAMIPYDLQAQSVTNTSAQLAWYDDHNAYMYRIEYRLVGENTFTVLDLYDYELPNGDLIALIEDLLPNKQYEWRMKAVLVNGFESPYTALHYFRTDPVFDVICNNRTTCQGTFDVSFPTPLNSTMSYRLEMIDQGGDKQYDYFYDPAVGGPVPEQLTVNLPSNFNEGTLRFVMINTGNDSETYKEFNLGTCKNDCYLSVDGREYSTDHINGTYLVQVNKNDPFAEPIYEAVHIDQCWMTENLNIGTKTSGVNDEIIPGDGIIEKICPYNDDKNCDNNGGLYSWDEAMNGLPGDDGVTAGAGSAQGICPEGWHLPSMKEFINLYSALNEGEGFGSFDDSFTAEKGYFAYGNECEPEKNHYNSLESGDGTEYEAYLTSTELSPVLFKASNNGNYLKSDFFFPVRCVKDISDPVSEDVNNLLTFTMSEPDLSEDKKSVSFELFIENIAGSASDVANIVIESGVPEGAVFAEAEGLIHNGGILRSGYFSLNPGESKSFSATLDLNISCNTITISADVVRADGVTSANMPSTVMHTIDLGFCAPIFVNENGTDVFIDPRDNREYPVVELNNQLWLGSNLNYTIEDKMPRCLQGDVVADPINQNSMCDENGQVYSWEEMMAGQEPDTGGKDGIGSAQGICPEGWHLPTNFEFNAIKQDVVAQEIHDGEMQVFNGAFNTVYSPNGYVFDGSNSDNGDGYFKYWTSSDNYTGEAGYPDGIGSTESYFDDILPYNDDYHGSFGAEIIYRCNNIYLNSDPDGSVSITDENKPSYFSVRCVKNKDLGILVDLDHKHFSNSLDISVTIENNNQPVENDPYQGVIRNIKLNTALPECILGPLWVEDAPARDEETGYVGYIPRLNPGESITYTYEAEILNFNGIESKVCFSVAEYNAMEPEYPVEYCANFETPKDFLITDVSIEEFTGPNWSLLADAVFQLNYYIQLLNNNCIEIDLGYYLTNNPDGTGGMLLEEKTKSLNCDGDNIQTTQIAENLFIPQNVPPGDWFISIVIDKTTVREKTLLYEVKKRSTPSDPDNGVKVIDSEDYIAIIFPVKISNPEKLFVLSEVESLTASENSFINVPYQLISKSEIVLNPLVSYYLTGGSLTEPYEMGTDQFLIAPLETTNVEEKFLLLPKGVTGECTLHIDAIAFEGTEEVGNELTIPVNILDENHIVYTKKDVNCIDCNNGEIRIIKMSNATYPVSYEWADGNTSQYRSGLAPGTFYVTATDRRGISVTQEITIGISNNAVQVPINLNVEPKQISALFTWAGNADSYEIYYREISGDYYKHSSTLNTFIEQDQLLPETQYEWKIRAVKNQVWSEFTDVQTFFTLPENFEDDENVPRINSQQELFVYQDESIEILFDHLNVSNTGDEYPDGFSLVLEEGNNYSIVGGSSVEPSQGFTGMLTVPVHLEYGIYNSNTVPLSIHVLPLIQPDLNITDISITEENIFANHDIEVKFLLNNDGDKTSEISNTGIYFSTDDILDADDILIGTVQSDIVYASMLQNVVSHVKIPSDITSGTFFLILHADMNENNPESNETNNAAAFEIDVISRPDFELEGMATDVSTQQAGSLINLFGNILNSGTSYSQASTCEIYLSSDVFYSADDLLLNEIELQAIEPGGMQLVSEDIYIPQGTAPGQWEILIFTDRLNLMSEINEENNNLVIDIEVTEQVYLPDITISNSGISTSIVTQNQSVTLTCTMHNEGQAFAYYPYMWYYLSNDDVFDEEDLMLGFDLYFYASPGGSSNESLITDDISGIPYGKNYILFIADKNDNINEENEENNITSLEFFYASPQPDVAANITGDELIKVKPGDNIVITGNFMNNSILSTGSVPMQLNLISDADFPDNIDFYLYTDNIVDIPSGQEVMKNYSISVPIDCDAGTYYICAVIDPLNALTELDEDNNYSMIPVEVLSSQPNLTVKSLSVVDATIEAGEKAHIDLIIKNEGEGSSNVSYAEVYLCNEDYITPGSESLFKTTILSLAAGDKEFASKEITIPANTAPGIWHIIVKADSESTVNESDETDNEQRFDIEITNSNNPPQLLSSQQITATEDEPFEILPDYLHVYDPDNIWPDDFTMTILPDANYSANGTIVTPAQDFNGNLEVLVSVNDGITESAPIIVPVFVQESNDAPVITGYNIVETDEEESFELSLSSIEATDIDNSYPYEHTLQIFSGENYSVRQSSSVFVLTPDKDFAGQVIIPAIVNDGTINSDPFDIVIDIININDPPKITDNQNIEMDKNTVYTITFDDLIIEDPDNGIEDFSVQIYPGVNYGYSETTIQPAEDFYGELAVFIKVSDGEAESAFYELPIVVNNVEYTLNTPDGISVIPISPYEIQVQWNAVDGAETYKITSCTDNTEILITPTSHTYSNLMPNTLYSYKVQAINNVGTSIQSSCFECYTMLEEVSGLSANAISTTEIELTWQNVDGANEYEIYSRSDEDYYSSGTTSLIISDLTPGTLYYFNVRAIGDNTVSEFCPMISETTSIDAPASLWVNYIYSDAIEFAWDEVDGATGYNVYLCSGMPLGQTSNTYYLADYLESGTEHSFMVEAYGLGEISERSSCISEYTSLEEPSGLYTTSLSESEIELSWDPVNNADYYDVFYCNGYPIDNTTGTSMIIYDLDPDTKYGFKVSAASNSSVPYSSDYSGCIFEWTQEYYVPNLSIDIYYEGESVWVTNHTLNYCFMLNNYDDNYSPDVMYTVYFDGENIESNFSGILPPYHWSIYCGSYSLPSGFQEGYYSFEVSLDEFSISDQVDVYIDAQDLKGLKKGKTFTSETSEKWNFILFPNPAYDFVNIFLDREVEGESFIVVTDILGKKLIQTKADFAFSKIDKLNISSLSKGVYFVTVMNNKTMRTKRLLISR